MKWRRFIRAVLVPAGVLAVGAAGFYVGRDVIYADQWPIYDGLRQTAAIIFGITGAWAAIVYPNALGNVLRRKPGKKSEGQAALNRLLAPMIVSTVILAVVLLAAITVPYVRRAAWLTQYPQLVRGLSFAVLTLLTAAELWALICMLVPMDNAKRELDRAANKAVVIGEARPRSSGDEHA